MPLRDIRHQAAIIRDHHILLIQAHDHPTGQSFWLLPGGGREGDESDEDCVCREVREETGLEVTVDRVLLDEVVPPNDLYHRVRTYLCPSALGEPTPGEEPEFADIATIIDARWFDLRSLDEWLPDVLANGLTMYWIHPIRAALGYHDSPSPAMSREGVGG